ncbi:unnamed protein product [uncultured bacterium]|nr:unnamed protein product [uncultured bacterium]
MSVSVSTLGFPRAGRHRESETALKRYWSGTPGPTTSLQSAMVCRSAKPKGKPNPGLWSAFASQRRA